MKYYFKTWQFWLRVIISPFGWLFALCRWIFEVISLIFDDLYDLVDRLLPVIPEDKTELKKRFDKESKKVDDLHK